jgi:ribonuclease P protein component
MKKQHRIRRNEEFNEIIQAKRFVSHPVFVVYTRKRREDQSRVGISVSKKLGGAVQRNLIKRQVRAMLQEITQYQESFDCVIIVRNGYKSGAFTSNRDALKEVFKKIQTKGI